MMFNDSSARNYENFFLIADCIFGAFVQRKTSYSIAQGPVSRKDRTNKTSKMIRNLENSKN